MQIVHPLADEWTDEYAVFVAQTSVVLLTEPLQSFLDWALSEGLRPVLLTDEAARLSPFVSLAMNRAGGFWAVRGERGGYDALTGLPIGGFADLWTGRPSEGERVPRFNAPAADPQAVLSYDIFGHQRAVADTRVGGMAETVHAALGGAALDLWGMVEPLVEPFGVEPVTETARRTMPESPTMHARACDGSYCDISVGRTRRGILEHIAGGVTIGGYPAHLAPLVEAATRALMAVEAAHQPTIGFVSVAEVGAGVLQGVGVRRPEVPLAVLIGPRAVHDLAPQVEQLRQRHDVLELGRRRLPSLLVRFSRTDQGSWAQLIAFAADLGLDRVRAAAGFDDVQVHDRRSGVGG
ncbi:DUF6177 family protein [Micropruina sp.]|uniref:DUF6177 family protein n=1 Tax=Micropruina sp. TaxID=2737536 RepID=UPI0039E449C2